MIKVLDRFMVRYYGKTGKVLLEFKISATSANDALSKLIYMNPASDEQIESISISVIYTNQVQDAAN